MNNMTALGCSGCTYMTPNDRTLWISIQRPKSFEMPAFNFIIVIVLKT